MKQQILIIGGTGFIGTELTNLYLRNGHEVVVLSQIDPSHHYHRDITMQKTYSENTFRMILSEREFDTIHFLSGNPSPHNSYENPYIDLDATNHTFMYLLEALRKTHYKGKLWAASSVAVYGANNEDPLRETSVTKPLSSYGVSKLMNEELLKMYNRSFGIRSGAYRIFSTYGPGLKRQIVYDLINKLINNADSIQVLGDGNDARDMTYVTDQASAIYLIDQKIEPNGDIFNTGSGNCYSVNDILHTIMHVMNITPNIQYTNENRTYDGKFWRADISKITSLGWCEKYSLHQGIQKTFEDLKR